MAVTRRDGIKRESRLAAIAVARTWQVKGMDRAGIGEARTVASA